MRIRQNFEAQHQCTLKNVLASPLITAQLHTENSDNAVY